MFKNLIESLRKKTLSLSDLPETIRVPGHAGQTDIDRLPLDQASVDDLAFAIQGLEARRAFVVPRGARNSSDTRSFDPQVLTGGSPLPRVPMRPSRGVVLEFEEGVTAVKFGSTR